MVDSQTEGYHLAYNYLAALDDRFLRRSADSQQGALPMAQYRCEPIHGPEDADGEGRSDHLVGQQFPVLCLFREIVRVSGDLKNVFALDIPYNRNNEALVQGHGDADVDLVELEDFVTDKYCVEGRDPY